ncbi:MAG: hypothetical protein JRH00_04240 [Deltaproteobacteria bacterium]|nr:hypothetical protein [Deltaproteobacteria bacterium]
MGDIEVTTNQLIKLLDISSRSRLTDWKHAGMPGYIERNRWDLKAVLDWFHENILQGAPTADPDIQKERLRWEKGRADKIEIQVKQLRRSLISRDEIHREWAARISLVVSGLNIYQDRLPPLLEGKTRNQMRAIIRKENERLRNWYIKEGS